MRQAVCAIVAMGATRGVLAQTDGEGAWKLSGSYLNLYTWSRTVVPPARDFVLDLNRLRVRLEARPVEGIAIDVQFDTEVLLGNYLKTAQYALTKARVETSFDLQREYVTRDEVVARSNLYRGIVTWAGKSTDVKVGRQRIALGTGFFWSPMDVLNPIDPTRLERDYRVGADAVLIEQKLGAVSRVSGIYVPSTNRLKSVGAGYVHGNVRGTDYSVLLGDFQGDNVLGVNFSTSARGLGFRGEATMTGPDSGARYARVLLGADYGFANSLNLSAEAYYNGQGTLDPQRYDLNGVLSGRALNLGRWYGAVAGSYEVTPLIKVLAYGVWNAGDGSLVLWPRLEWSVRANVDLVAGIQHFTGGARSEYGRLSSLAHGEVRWFF